MQREPERQTGESEIPSGISTYSEPTRKTKYTKKIRPSIRVKKSTMNIPNKYTTNKINDLEKEVELHKEALKILKEHLEKDTKHPVQEKIEYIPIVFNGWANGVGYDPIVMVRSDSDDIRIATHALTKGAMPFRFLELCKAGTFDNNGMRDNGMSCYSGYMWLDLDMLSNLKNLKSIEYYPNNSSRKMVYIYKNKEHLLSNKTMVAELFEKALPGIAIDLHM